MKTLQILVGLFLGVGVTVVVASQIPVPVSTEVKDAECRVACRREGHNLGLYLPKTSKCACVTYFDYKKITRQEDTATRLEGVPLNNDQWWYK